MAAPEEEHETNCLEEEQEFDVGSKLSPILNAADLNPSSVASYLERADILVILSQHPCYT